MLAIERQHAAHAVGAAGRGWARPAELGLAGADIVAPDGSCVAAGLTLAVRAGQVRERHRVGPGVGPTSAFHSSIPPGCTGRPAPFGPAPTPPSLQW